MIPLRTAKQDLGTSEGIFSKFPKSTPVLFFKVEVSPGTVILQQDMRFLLFLLVFKFSVVTGKLMEEALTSACFFMSVV